MALRSIEVVWRSKYAGHISKELGILIDDKAFIFPGISLHHVMPEGSGLELHDDESGGLMRFVIGKVFCSSRHPATIQLEVVLHEIVTVNDVAAFLRAQVAVERPDLF